MIQQSNDKAGKEYNMSNERVYVALSIALTGVIIFILMTAFDIQA